MALSESSSLPLRYRVYTCSRQPLIAEKKSPAIYTSIEKRRAASAAAGTECTNRQSSKMKLIGALKQLITSTASTSSLTPTAASDHSRKDKQQGAGEKRNRVRKPECNHGENQTTVNQTRNIVGRHDSK